MKKIICLLPLFAWTSSAAAVAVGPLPAPAYADTEVSTNFPFSVGEGRNAGLEFSVELQATPSNNVEVAIGVDSDSDGRLSADESELCVGYDCGTWFVRSSAQDAVTAEDRPGGPGCSVFQLVGRLACVESPNRLEAAALRE